MPGQPAFVFGPSAQSKRRLPGIRFRAGRGAVATDQRRRRCRAALGGGVDGKDSGRRGNKPFSDATQTDVAASACDASSACAPQIPFWLVLDLPKMRHELGVAVPHYFRRLPLALEMPSQAGDQEDSVSRSAAPQDSAKSTSTRSVRKRNLGRRGGQTGAPGGGALKARPVPETPAAGLQDPEMICARPYQVRSTSPALAKTSFANNLCKCAKSPRRLCPT